MGSIEPSKGPEPLAVIGMSCRLPGGNDTPTALWKFLQDSRVASNKVPMSRFNVENHFQGAGRRQPMKSLGAMCLDTDEIHAFDAGFFGISRGEAMSMDPQQRHLLEVVHESLENAGIPIDLVSGSCTGCFVASFTVDYEDMQKREPEHRPPSVITGIGRAILSNRISHCFNLKGPSMSIDTGCSGSLVAVDAACRYISSGDINMAIVAAANLFLSPEHLMNEGSMGFIHSPTGLCHSFDEKADGYVKAEGVNCVILKRLGDALRDCDPIRAVIRGWSTNSDGNTLGISTPDAKSQAACIKSAYKCAGIENLGATSYIECHGTGTPAGDATELKGISLAFKDVLQGNAPLQIGSIKSNIGHSEPAAGLSGLIKAILCLENGTIPGNPTLLTPHPDLDFVNLRMQPSRTARPWPSVPVRRAGVNSFGYGGSNSHVIVDEATPYLNRFTGTSHVSSYSSTVDIFADDDECPTARPYIIPLSGVDESSLKGNCQRLVRHLAHMEVQVQVEDLAYTLAARRSHFPFRAYTVTSISKLNMESFTLGKPSMHSPRVAFVFTGQGAQWPSKLGSDLVRTFPLAENILRQLDRVLQSVENPPSWSLFEKFIEPQDAKAPDLPAISQPLLTATQIILVHLLESWGICPQSVVGHSAGEVASGYAAGFLTKEEAIKIAFYRGHSTQSCQNNSDSPYGMLAVGLGPSDVQKYLQDSEDQVQIACFNSPSSITLSGTMDALVNLKQRLDADAQFCQLLNVNKAYHSRFIQPTAEMFANFVQHDSPTEKTGKHDVKMFSTVTGHLLDTILHNTHWKNNMMLPVQFTQACSDMLLDSNAPTVLLELGPSNALKGPVAQIQSDIFGDKACAQYYPAFVKGDNPMEGIFNLAGCLYLAGAPIALDEVNRSTSAKPRHIVDLPNYAWDHSTKHWHENESSKDWRMRLFPHHELLGTKILGSSWNRPSWKRTFRLCDVSWMSDHQVAGSVLFPGAGYVAMAVEAVQQMMIALDTYRPIGENYEAQFKLRNILFKKALPLNDTREIQHLVTLHPLDDNIWYGFQISSLQESSWIEHCSGQITRRHSPAEFSSEADMRPLEHSISKKRCYESFTDTGYCYGPTFQKIEAVEVLGSSLEARSLVSLDRPRDASQKSSYPIHPCALDGCLQTIIAASWEGDITSLTQPAVILSIDSLEINEWPLKHGGEVICLSTKEYSGRGRLDLLKSYTGSVLAYRKDDNRLALRAEGVRQAPILASDQRTKSKYHKVSWKPDIALADKGFSLSEPTTAGKVQELIDMIIHKGSPSNIAEVHFGQSQEPSFWLSDSLSSPREDYKSCSIFCSNLRHLEEARKSLSTRQGVQIAEFRVNAPEFGITEELDFILVGVNEQIKRNKVQLAVEKLTSHLSSKGYMLLIDLDQASKTSPVSFEDLKVSSVGESESGIINEKMCQALSNFRFKFHEIETPQNANFKALSCTPNYQSNDTQNDKYVHIPHFSTAALIPEKLRSMFEEAGYTVVEHQLPFDKISRDQQIVVLDELQSPILINPAHIQWEGLKALTKSNSKLLWVTKESQHKVRQPDTALVHGLFRTIRAENPQCTLITLDLESSAMASLSTIFPILQYLDRPPPPTELESEFVERGGVIYISRIIPHETECQHNKEASKSLQCFDHTEKCFGLQCGSLGALDSLEFVERASPMMAVKDGHVEVDMRAVGMNFKDVAIVMGVVDENEHTLGSEGAGVVKRVGADVQDFQIGDRVMLIHSGCLGNRTQVPQGRVQRIPSSVSFEDAATMPVCFSTAIYSMLIVGNLQSGQTVLIHSAAGGLGLSCIQIARYVGAEIFATVGTQEKVDFLVNEHGIPHDHIFSSRDTQFAGAIIRKTRGLGVDLILNTLVGDLLHESWRICADGGIFVELGKRDIRDRKSISMEPFDRNCSFRAVDLSYKQITDELMKGILNRIHDLVINGHIKPLRPVTPFPFNDVQGAFRYLAKASHIGKVILSCSHGKSKCMVSFRSAQPNVQLRPDASYLIVSGLKGICGRFAFYMVKAGARHLVIMSRSGCYDTRSQSVLARLRHMGCEVVIIQGDVCRLGDVERAIAAGPKPVAGIIHGAMVPIGNVFENTSATDFAAIIAPKVAGSWNLHTAALNRGLDLDFFTMLSSLSAVIGLKGNASYAAGNHFQDAFAAYRQSLGLAANAIDLSLVEDVGYMTESTSVKQQVADEGILVFLKERDLDRIIRDSILEQITGSGDGIPQLITGLNSPIPVTGDELIDTRFSTIITRDTVKVSGPDSGYDDLTTKLIVTLQKKDEVKRDTLVTAALQAFSLKLMQVLQTGEEPLDPEKSLASYGLDSLSAMQFRNWVQVTLGVEMSTVDITSAPSLHGLTQNFVDRVRK